MDILQNFVAFSEYMNFNLSQDQTLDGKIEQLTWAAAGATGSESSLVHKVTHVF